MKYKFLSRIFNDNINIGFGSPATDIHTYICGAGRECVEVGSVGFNFITKLKISDHITELSLYSDGRGGQNKNSHIVHMVMISHVRSGKRKPGF